MSNEILDKIYEIIKAEPHAGQSLLLFALLKTLDIPKGGHMYMLGKLKEMTPENRQLAFGLMSLMAENKTQDDEWISKVRLIESAIRNNK